MMDPASIKREYAALRAASVSLNSRLVKALKSEEIVAAGAALGMRRGTTLNEGQVSVLMDYAVHNIFRGGRSAVERVLAEDPPPEGSVELRLLRSMQNSRHTLVEVQTPLPGLGVRALMGPEKTPILLVDLAFSHSAEAGVTMAARVHSPGEGWWITTGAALPLTPIATDRIIRQLQEYVRRYGGEPSEQDRTTMFIRTCMETDVLRHVEYNQAGTSSEPLSVTAVHRTPKVGRNAPCPCGSGKKHKKCCGA